MRFFTTADWSYFSSQPLLFTLLATVFVVTLTFLLVLVHCLIFKNYPTFKLAFDPLFDLFALS